MKAVILNGQNHHGSTYHLAHLLAEHLPEGTELTEFFLPRDLDHFCLGCYACLEGDESCPFYAEKRLITDALEQAELLIFTTPNYCMLPSAQLTAFIDLTFTYWMSHRPRACMFAKKAVVLSTTAGAGAGKAAAGVKKALQWWGVPYVKSYGAAVQAMSWSGVKPEKQQRLERDMASLAQKLSSGRPPRVGIKTRLIFKMMAGIQKSGMGSSPIEREYWDKNGWLGKARPWKR